MVELPAADGRARVTSAGAARSQIWGAGGAQQYEKTVLSVRYSACFGDCLQRERQRCEALCLGTPLLKGSRKAGSWAGIIWELGAFCLADTVAKACRLAAADSLAGGHMKSGCLVLESRRSCCTPTAVVRSACLTSWWQHLQCRAHLALTHLRGLNSSSLPLCLEGGLRSAVHPALQAMALGA